MKKHLCLLFLLLPIVTFSQEAKTTPIQDSIVNLETSVDSISQDTTLNIDTSSVFIVVEKRAQFPGGERALYQFIYKNISYPEMARELEVQGRVFIGFVVEKDGSITNVKAIKSKANQLGYGLEAEAIRAIKKMPNWIPAEQSGKKVRMKFTLPVLFQLK